MKKIEPEQRPYSLPQEGFVRLKDVLKVIPISRSSWYNGVATGKFPTPTKLGPKTSAYPVADIRAVINSFGRQEVS